MLKPYKSLITRKYGFKDENGKVVAKSIYDDYNNNRLGDGFLRVERKGKWGCIDEITGREIVECKYDEPISEFIEGFARVRKNDLFGFVNREGREVIECKYDLATSFCDGFAMIRVKDGNKTYYNYIDKNGRQLIQSNIYSFANDFSKGLAAVERDGHWGFIDRTGREVIECKYDYVGDFKEGLAPVRKGEKIGYIDRTGKEIIECKYDSKENLDMFYFKDGFAPVRKGNLWGCIDKTGREVIEFKYSKYSNNGSETIFDKLEEYKLSHINEVIDYIKEAYKIRIDSAYDRDATNEEIEEILDEYKTDLAEIAEDYEKAKAEERKQEKRLIEQEKARRNALVEAAKASIERAKQKKAKMTELSEKLDEIANSYLEGGLKVD